VSEGVGGGQLLEPGEQRVALTGRRFELAFARQTIAGLRTARALGR
jgi:hypothetical protein